MINKYYLKCGVIIVAALITGQTCASEVTIINCSPNEKEVCVYHLKDKLKMIPYEKGKIAPGSKRSFKCARDRTSEVCTEMVVTDTINNCNGYIMEPNHGTLYYYNDTVHFDPPGSCP